MESMVAEAHAGAEVKLGSNDKLDIYNAAGSTDVLTG